MTAAVDLTTRPLSFLIWQHCWKLTTGNTYQICMASNLLITFLGYLRLCRNDARTEDADYRLLLPHLRMRRSHRPDHDVYPTRPAAALCNISEMAEWIQNTDPFHCGAIVPNAALAKSPLSWDWHLNMHRHEYKSLNANPCLLRKLEEKTLF